jgi:hypothetical protein
VANDAAELDDRYRGLDASVRAPLIADMKAEDSELKQNIKKHRLNKWFDGCVDAAKRAVAQEAAEEEKQKKAMKEVSERLERIERDVERKEKERALEMLRARPKGMGFKATRTQDAIRRERERNPALGFQRPGRRDPKRFNLTTGGSSGLGTGVGFESSIRS